MSLVYTTFMYSSYYTKESIKGTLYLFYLEEYIQFVAYNTKSTLEPSIVVMTC